MSTGGPAATSASSSTSLGGAGAVVTRDHSAASDWPRSALKVPRALWYSISSPVSSVFSQSHETAKAPASSGAEMPSAHLALERYGQHVTTDETAWSTWP